MIIGILFCQPIKAGDIGVPDWLKGKPDVSMKQNRCGVYERFFYQADKQTDGAASKDDFASQRVVNIVNKLVDYHRAKPQNEYSGKIKYLMFGDTGPFHFEFRISHEELERSLKKNCDE